MSQQEHTTNCSPPQSEIKPPINKQTKKTEETRIPQSLQRACPQQPQDLPLHSTSLDYHLPNSAHVHLWELLQILKPSHTGAVAVNRSPPATQCGCSNCYPTARQAWEGDVAPPTSENTSTSHGSDGKRNSDKGSRYISAVAMLCFHNDIWF